MDLVVGIGTFQEQAKKSQDLIVWIGTVEEQVNCLISTLRLLQETVVERRLEFFLFLHVKSFTKC